MEQELEIDFLRFQGIPSHSFTGSLSINFTYTTIKIKI